MLDPVRGVSLAWLLVAAGCIGSTGRGGDVPAGPWAGDGADGEGDAGAQAADPYDAGTSSTADDDREPTGGPIASDAGATPPSPDLPPGGDECVRTTCVASGAHCGSILDGCGGTLECGTCTGDLTCGGAGVPHVCGSPSCTSTSCLAEGKNCGQIPDGCGGMLSCGECAGSQSCGASGIENVCGTANCTPTTCIAQGKDCGQIPDGCGGTLVCGACSGFDTCGGGGVANQCGCIARSTCGQGVCGQIADGCGGTLDCGPCATTGCREGLYQGEFSGNYVTSTFPVSLPVNGTMSFRLTSIGGGQYQLTNGSMSGTSAAGVAIVGTVSGTIDCMDSDTVQLSGSYTVSTTYSFTGTATATYQDSTLGNGTWQVSEATAAYGGTGTWGASWAGP